MSMQKSWMRLGKMGRIKMNLHYNSDCQGAKYESLVMSKESVKITPRT